MSDTKEARLVYVAAMAKELTGISRDMPSHVKVDWVDDLGRRNSRELLLSDDEVARIAALPNAPRWRKVPPTVEEVAVCEHWWNRRGPSEKSCLVSLDLDKEREIVWCGEFSLCPSDWGEEWLPCPRPGILVR